MIDHILHYYGNGFFYTWTIQMPFRLNKGDQIASELLSQKANLQDNKEETDEWIKFTCDEEYFEIEHIQINHNADVVVWLMLAK